jgi:hypothetical protein
VIVAESLRRVPEPPLVFRPLTFGEGRAVAAAIAGSLAPPRAPDPAPAWLHPGQEEAFRRALAAIARYGGALVAEPVGTGKTYIALAAAAARGEGAACIVPASVRGQWLRAARRTGVEAQVMTHEQWSRGSRPIPPGLVIVDESHRFRNPGTRRHAHLARALLGRAGLLLSATPIVNRLDDLTHQLLLFVRDDALAPAGLGSLTRALATGSIPPAIADVLITGTTDIERPLTIDRSSPAGPAEDATNAELLGRLDHLYLSPSRSVRALVRGGFATALASSPAALRTVLERYRHLLLHARDAARSGQALTRQALQRALNDDWSQLVFWELLDRDAEGATLDDRDLPRLEAVLSHVREVESGPDPKAERLRQWLDGRVTVAFVGARATVHHLRRRLGPASRIAWCTGEEAGIGPSHLPRADVLDWFRPGVADPAGLGPRVLIATDVASEGLDLQRAALVIHYDLPWTAVRLEQRAGRAVRLGSPHAAIEVVSFLPSPVLERRLRLNATLRRKGQLPAQAGLAPDPATRCRWRQDVAARFGVLPSQRGLAEARGRAHAALAGIELWSGDRLLATHALVRRLDGSWSESADEVTVAIEAASRGPMPGPCHPAGVRRELGRLAGPVRRLALAAATGLRAIRNPQPGAAASLRRVQLLASAAIRARDPVCIDAAERGLHFLQRGHTAGEQYLAAGLYAATNEALLALLRRLPPPTAPPAPVRARLVGLIRFRPE